MDNEVEGNYKLLPAENGLEAVEICEKSKY